MSLSIIYAVIARDNKIILTDFSEYSGNFQQASIILLRKIEKNSRKQIKYPPYLVFYEDVEGVTYMLIASNIKQEVAFSFLSDMRKKFISTYDNRIINQSYSYTLKNFSSEIKTIVRFYEDNQYYVRPDVLMDEKGNKMMVEVKNVDEVLSMDEKVDISSTKINTSGIDIYDEYKIKSRNNARKKRTRMIQIGVVVFVLLIILIIYYCFS